MSLEAMALEFPHLPLDNCSVLTEPKARGLGGGIEGCGTKGETRLAPSPVPPTGSTLPQTVLKHDRRPGVSRRVKHVNAGGSASPAAYSDSGPPRDQFRFAHEASGRMV